MKRRQLQQRHKHTTVRHDIVMPRSYNCCCCCCCCVRAGDKKDTHKFAIWPKYSPTVTQTKAMPTACVPRVSVQ